LKKQTKPPHVEPLRVPGQSLDKRIDHVLDEKVLLPLLAVGMCVCVSFLEWGRFIFKIPPQPVAVTVLLFAVSIWATWRIRRAWRELKALRLGRNGERFVATYLESLRPLGFWVYHDVPTGGANIDHVLIGTRGIYTIETKTLSKPDKGDCKIRINSDGISANGQMLSRNPLTQAKAQAGWLRHYFGEASFNVPVKPVVLFPGWFVEPNDRKAAGAWVLEPKALESFIKQESETIPQENARAMALALASYIRAQAEL
jgi:Nuclease-related domain